MEANQLHFLFFYAALQSIPRSLIEAAASTVQARFAASLRLRCRLSLGEFLPAGGEPGIRLLRHLPGIDAATSGGPVQATTTLIYKITAKALPDWIWLRLPRSRWCDVPRHRADGGAVPLC